MENQNTLVVKMILLRFKKLKIPPSSSLLLGKATAAPVKRMTLKDTVKEVVMGSKRHSDIWMDENDRIFKLLI